MKKTLALLMVLLLALGCFAACKSGSGSGGSDVPASDGEITGTWVLSKAKVSGLELNASDLGVDMSFTFKADGSGSMVNDGETVDGIEWKLEGNTVKLGAGGQVLYDLTFDGSTLLLHEPESGVDLIFTKK